MASVFVWNDKDFSKWKMFNVRKYYIGSKRDKLVDSADILCSQNGILNWWWGMNFLLNT